LCKTQLSYPVDFHPFNSHLASLDDEQSFDEPPHNESIYSCCLSWHSCPCYACCWRPFCLRIIVLLVFFNTFFFNFGQYISCFMFMFQISSFLFQALHYVDFALWLLFSIFLCLSVHNKILFFLLWLLFGALDAKFVVLIVNFYVIPVWMFFISVCIYGSCCTLMLTIDLLICFNGCWYCWSKSIVSD
jgi:hypothetical protein